MFNKRRVSRRLRHCRVKHFSCYLLEYENLGIYNSLLWKQFALIKKYIFNHVFTKLYVNICRVLNVYHVYIQYLNL